MSLINGKLLYKTLPGSVVKEKINRIYFGGPDAKGNELTTAIMKAAHNAKLIGSNVIHFTLHPFIAFIAGFLQIELERYKAGNSLLWFEPFILFISHFDDIVAVHITL
jgi:hypothetical protein